MLDVKLAIGDWKSVQEEGFPIFAGAFDHIAFKGCPKWVFSQFLKTIFPDVVSYIRFKSKHGVDDLYGVVDAANSSREVLKKKKEALEKQLCDHKEIVGNASKEAWDLELANPEMSMKLLDLESARDRGSYMKTKP